MFSCAPSGNPDWEVYFFLYPVGHLGLAPVTFLTTFPFTQEIVFLVASMGAESDFADALGAGAGVLLATPVTTIRGALK